MLCKHCDALVINGIKCHEIGCPVAWQDSERECKWCGISFKPQEKNQDCCSEECAKIYYNY